MKQFYSKSMAFIKKMNISKSWAKIGFVFIGIMSTIWFLVRVITKPSRATYPCMKAAAPLMSSFIIYVLAISGTAFAFKKFRSKLASAKYLAAASFLVVAVIMIFASNAVYQKKAKAIALLPESYFVANTPIGTATGLKPGRVVWMWNEDATDKNFTPSNSKTNWWANFTDGAVVESMLGKAITTYAENPTVKGSWDALFKYFNQEHGKGSVGYTPGEKIYIKINITNSASGSNKTKDFDRMDATPELALALLKHLVEEVGVAQSDIYLGDPFRRFHNLYWNMCHSVYPDVVYCDGTGQDGRHQTKPTTKHVMVFSDSKLDFRIPQEYVDAAYIINMPCLKSHDAGGITLGAKNHQGSVLQDGGTASNQYIIDMHYALPGENPGYGEYRHLVDYLGHKDVGGKTLVTIIDGIWAGHSWQGFVRKWNMAPFKGDYPSSLFVSQDKVAIDAVCYDFLLEEYRTKTSERYPYYLGADDYLKQAADPSNWPSDIVYDPEGDGTPLTSMGVYEHWNNATDKKYSRNLGSGNGIELIALTKSDMVSVTDLKTNPNGIAVKLYPNPAKDNVNIEYNLSEACQVSANIFDLSGKRVAVLFDKIENKGKFTHQFNSKNLNSGNYFVQIKTKVKGVESFTSVKLDVMK
jgi:hypothetical protein